MASIEVQPLATALGAEIAGIDLSAEVGDRLIGDIRQALLDYGVIFFRDQTLDVEAHKRLARRFGEIFIHPNFDTGEGDPEVVNIVRRPGDTHIVGEEWHTDTTMMAEPPMGRCSMRLTCRRSAAIRCLRARHWRTSGCQRA